MRLGSSLVIRLISALIAVTFLAAASLLAAIFFFSVQRPMNEMRAEIQAEAAQLQSIYLRQGKAGLEAALIARRQLPSANLPFDALLERDGSLLTGNLPGWPRTRRGDWATIEADVYRDGQEDDREALSRDLLLPDGRRLIVGRDVDVIADRQELMAEAALWGSLSVLLFALLGGYWISKITAARLDAVTNTARAVMKGDLGVRVPVKGTANDFDQLGMSLNAMLDRNEELVASLARVSDNIAHELRTPLARLRAALDGSSSEVDIQLDQINAARVEAERLQQIFDALLRIARLDTGRHLINRDTIQLDALVNDAVDFYAPEAESRRQSLNATVVPCVISGDRNLIFQAVANLLDNALKFAPDGGEVRAYLDVDGAMVRLSICDNGPGVDEEFRHKLAERFFRAPGSEAVAGTGLGLSLANAIVEAHNGTLSFAGGPGAFAAVMRLPMG